MRNPRSNPQGQAPKPNDRGEHITTLSHTPLEPLPEEPGTTTQAALINQSDIKADATQLNPNGDGEGGKPTKYYRIENGGNVLDKNGYRTRLHPGKEIDDLNYNIDRLRKQGIKLTEITAEERTAAPMSAF